MMTTTGTLKSSIFMLLQSTLGTGILTLPFAFRSAGAFGGIALLTFYCLASVGAHYILIAATDAAKAQSYSDIINYYMDKKWKNIFSIIIAAYSFVSIISSFVIVKHTLSIYASHSSFIPILGAVVISFPLSIMRRMTHLKYGAFVSFTIWICIVCMIIFCSKDPNGEATMTMWGESSFIRAIPQISLSFHAHIQLPSIYADLKFSNRTPALMMRAVMIAYSIIWLLYVLVASFGYSRFGTRTCSNIMACPYNHQFIVLGRTGVAFTAILSIPIYNLSIRDAMWSFMTKGFRNELLVSKVVVVVMKNEEEESSTKLNHQRQEITMKKIYMSTAAVLFSAAMFALPVKELSTLSALTGMIGGVAVMYILPSIFVWKRKTESNVGAVVYFGVGVLTFVACGCSFLGVVG